MKNTTRKAPPTKASKSSKDASRKPAAKGAKPSRDEARKAYAKGSKPTRDEGRKSYGKSAAKDSAPKRDEPKKSFAKGPAGRGDEPRKSFAKGPAARSAEPRKSFANPGAPNREAPRRSFGRSSVPQVDSHPSFDTAAPPRRPAPLNAPPPVKKDPRKAFVSVPTPTRDEIRKRFAPTKDIRPESHKSFRQEAEEAKLERRNATPVFDPAMASHTPLLRGEWLFTTREGYETDLVQEQQQSKHLRVAAPRIIGPGLVASGGEYQEWAFARQALFVRSIVRAETSTKLDRAVAESIRELAAKDKALQSPWSLQVWTTDTLEGNKLARTADVLDRSVLSQCAAIDAGWSDRHLVNAKAAREAGGWVAQVCVRSPVEAVIGFQRAVELHSMHPGGRARMRVEGESPSRAAKKLEEAFDWFGVAPTRGDRCVDLGAAPGGWTKVLLDRGAIVTAVDPGQMAAGIRANRSLVHVLGSAFDYAPDSPVDWLFCDMVWRPLEVVALLAKWARRGWASMMIANVKLPMKSKAEFVHRLRDVLRDGGWEHVRVRQLYHDREEVTFAANRK